MVEVFRDFSVQVGVQDITTRCTFPAKRSCWAVSNQNAWNELFNPRGVEVIEMQKPTLYFRTLDVNPDSLPADGDADFMCLYLWLLGEHHCISAVRLCIPVLAPRHCSLFLSLLKLNWSVRKCEVDGGSPLTTPALLTGWLTADVVKYLFELRVLRLATLRLSDEDVSLLADLVRRNDSLVALVLIDVKMNALALKELATTVAEHKKLQDFRLSMATVQPQHACGEVVSVISQSSSLSRLYIHLNDGLLNLLRGLLNNSSLTELTLETAIDDEKVLHALVDFVVNQKSFKRLKIRIDARKFEHAEGVLDDMERIIGQSSLDVLVLSGSTLPRTIVSRLADGLAVSATLRELYLDDCQLACADVLPLIEAISSSLEAWTFEELYLGAMAGDDSQLCELLRKIMDAYLCDKVTLTYGEGLIPTFLGALRMGLKFVKVTISGVDPPLHSIFHSLRTTVSTLKSLSIDTDQEIDRLTGVFLGSLIQKANCLEVLRLRCRPQPVVVTHILKAIGNSASIEALSLEHWSFEGEAVTAAFVEMLRQNRRLHRLEIHWNSDEDYDSFQTHLAEGLSLNMSVFIVKQYCNEVLHVRKDFELLQPIRRNSMILAWVIDLILRDKLYPAGAAVVDTLNTCEAYRDLFRSASDLSPRTTEDRKCVARKATRTQLYTLLSVFRGHRDFCLKADGKTRLDNLLYSMRGQVLKAIKSSKDTSDDEGKVQVAKARTAR